MSESSATKIPTKVHILSGSVENPVTPSSARTHSRQNGKREPPVARASRL